VKGPRSQDSASSAEVGQAARLAAIDVLTATTTRGRRPRDRFAHLHLIGEALRYWLVPRWKRGDRLVYTRIGEQQ
jgi:hypothetical protein